MVRAKIVTTKNELFEHLNSYFIPHSRHPSRNRHSSNKFLVLPNGWTLYCTYKTHTNFLFRDGSLISISRLSARFNIQNTRMISSILSISSIVVSTAIIYKIILLNLMHKTQKSIISIPCFVYIDHIWRIPTIHRHFVFFMILFSLFLVCSKPLIDLPFLQR